MIVLSITSMPNQTLDYKEAPDGLSMAKKGEKREAKRGGERVL
jgi:hypothetical protein